MSAVVVVLAVLVVPAVGTLIRAAVTDLDAGLARRSLATLALNLVGSALLGVVARGDGGDAEFVFGVLGLGALTTFSTFVAQVVEWFELGRRGVAAGYVVATLAGSVAAAAITFWA